MKKLVNTPIKSIREKKVNITEAYCIIHNNEVWVKNIDIAKYSFCTSQNYEPKKERKLLLKKTMKTQQLLLSLKHLIPQNQNRKQQESPKAKIPEAQDLLT